MPYVYVQNWKIILYPHYLESIKFDNNVAHRLIRYTSCEFLLYYLYKCQTDLPKVTPYWVENNWNLNIFQFWTFLLLLLLLLLLLWFCSYRLSPTEYCTHQTLCIWIVLFLLEFLSFSLSFVLAQFLFLSYLCSFKVFGERELKK